jgi:hypothetical protein
MCALPEIGWSAAHFEGKIHVDRWIIGNDESRESFQSTFAAAVSSFQDPIRLIVKFPHDKAIRRRHQVTALLNAIGLEGAEPSEVNGNTVFRFNHKAVETLFDMVDLLIRKGMLFWVHCGEREAEGTGHSADVFLRPDLNAIVDRALDGTLLFLNRRSQECVDLLSVRMRFD